MPTTNTLVIGAGQAGLAMSRCLTDTGIDHVVLERGRTAERWRSERWESLRLLSPNWASRLPGWTYRGAHPDYRRSYPWLRVPVLDSSGEIAHRRRITAVAGIHVLGQRFQHRRDSNFIDGVRHDAGFVARRITSRCRHTTAPSMSCEDAS